MFRFGAWTSLILFTTIAAQPARAIFIDWSTSTIGTIGPASISITGLSNGPEQSLSTYDLTGTPYIAFPGSGAQESLNYLCTDDWTATSSQPLSNVRLYAILWRGDEGGVNPVQYTFNRSVSIASGFNGASLAGSTLSLPAGDFYEGILQFTGTFSSLTVTSNATLENAQAMTLSATIIPEPLAATSIGIGILLMITARPQIRARDKKLADAGYLCKAWKRRRGIAQSSGREKR